MYFIANIAFVCEIEELDSHNEFGLFGIIYFGKLRLRLFYKLEWNFTSWEGNELLSRLEGCTTVEYIKVRILYNISYDTDV